MPSHCTGTSLVLGNCAPHVEKQQPNCRCYSRIQQKQDKKKKKKILNSEKRKRGKATVLGKQRIRVVMGLEFFFSR